MTKQVQRRRGTATQHTSFTGAEGELSVNTTNKSVHVHDNVTAGGFEAARVDMDNVTSSSILTAAGITATTTELNYVDGVTSAIQTQLDGKAGTASPTFTGTLTTANLTATGTTTLAGASTSADITFGDNDKAVFGAGSDLQIYHDGSHSIIKDAGTGNLQINAGNFNVNNVANTANIIVGNDGGDVNLYYNGSKKLATTSTGIDVTGTVTADGLTVDGGITTTTSNVALDVVESTASSDVIIGVVADGSGRSQIRATQGLGANSDLRFLTKAAGVTREHLKLHETGDISFYDTSGNAKLFWDASAESLGVGTSSPSAKLEVETADLGGTAGDSEESLRLTTSNTNSDKLVFTNERLSTGTTWTSAAHRIQRVVDSSKMGYIQFGSVTNDLITFGENTTERMRIDGDGKVGIGTSSPVYPLVVQAANPRIQLLGTGTNTGISGLLFGDADTATRGQINYNHTSDSLDVVVNGVETMRITSSGSVGIGTSLPTGLLDLSATTGSGTLNIISTVNAANAGNKIAFFAAGRSDTDEEMAYIKPLLVTNSGGSGNVQEGHLTFGTSGSEAMRIDSSGNVGIGLTPSTSDPLTNVSAGVLQVDGNMELRFAGSNVDPTGARFFNIVNTDTTLVADQPLGGLQWIGLDSTNPNSNMASITSYCAGNGGTTGDIRFKIAGSEAARIDSSGNLLVGKTTTASDPDTGMVLQPDGIFKSTSDGSRAGDFNRGTSDGEIVRFSKDGSTVGSIGAVSGDLVIDGASGDAGLRFLGSTVRPRDNGALSDGGIDLGASNGRFKDLYLSGGVYLGGTGASNLLDSYEVGTWTPVVSATSSAPSSISYSERTGFYTKIGNLVTLQCELRISSKSGGSGGATITGIPFACKGVDIVPVGSMEASFINLSTGYSMFAVMTYQSQSAIFLRQYGDNVAESSISIGSVGSSSRIRFTITYQTQ